MRQILHFGIQSLVRFGFAALCIFWPGCGAGPTGSMYGDPGPGTEVALLR